MVLASAVPPADLLTAFVERNHNPMLVVRASDGVIVYVNEAAARFYGYDRGDLAGKPVWHLNAAGEPAFEAVRDRLATAPCASFVVAHRLASGELRRIETSVTAIVLDGERYFANTITDVTERLRAEESIRASEAELEAYLMSPAVGVAITDPEDRWITVNDRLCEMLGYSREELVGRTFQDVTHPEDRTVHLQGSRELLDGKLKTLVVEKRYVRKDGSELWAMTSVTTPQTRDGRGLNRIAVIQDIGRRVEAERQLRDSENRFRTLFENLREQVSIFRVVRDGRGAVVDWTLLHSNGAARKYGIPHGRFVPGQGLAEAFGREAVQGLLGRTDELMSQSQPFRELYFAPLGRWYLASSFGLDRDTIVSVSLDVTEQREAEEAVRASEARYNALFQILPVGVVVTDESGQIIDANPASEEMLGLTRSEQRGRRFDAPEWEIVHPNGTPMPAEEYASVRAFKERRTVSGVEMGVARPDGTLRWLVVTATPIPVRGYGVVITHVDVTGLRQAEREAARQAARYRQLTETSREGIHVLDEEGRLVEANPAFLASIQRSPQEVPSLKLGDWSARIGSAIPVARIRTLMDRPERFETLHRRRDGTLFDVEIDAVGIALEGKRYLLATARDITARKQLERSLKRAKEVAHLGQWTWDIASDEVSCCEELCRIFGAAEPQVRATLACLLKRFAHADDQRRVLHATSLVASGAPPEAVESRMVRPDGSIRYLWSLPSDIQRDGAGKAVVVSGITQDVTERRMAEIARARSEARFRAVLESSREGVYFADGQRHLTYRSAAAERISGFTNADRLGRDPVELIHPDDTNPFEAAWARSLATPGTPVSGEFRFKRKDGEWRIAEATFLNLLGHEEVGEVVLILADITERRGAEERLRDALKLEAVGHLAGGIAHEFNNILTGMVISIEMLREAGAVGFLRHDLDVLKASAERAAKLVRQLLAYSRKSLIHSRPTDWAECVSRQLPKLAQQASSAGIQLGYAPPASVDRVNADPSLLEAVLDQLCTNAREAMPSGGTISLSLEAMEVSAEQVQGIPDRSPGRYVCLAVADTGEGMTDQVKSRLFEPFFSTKVVAPGRGLGLATAHGMVTQMGGWIDVESEAGKGTTFRVYLPTISAVAA